MGAFYIRCNGRRTALTGVNSRSFWNESGPAAHGGDAGCRFHRLL